MKATRLLVGLCVLIALSALAPGQCPPPSWHSMNRLSGFDAAGFAVQTSWDPDGAGPAPPVLVVGGGFNVVDDITASNIARWDGSTWQALGSGVQDGYVSALAVYNGELIAGGAFSMVGGVGAPNIARWNGSTWQPLGGGVAGRVNALAVYNNELYVASEALPGGFSSIVKWNGASWSGLGWVGTTSWIYAMTVYNGELIVGGSFGGGSLLRWNGTTWLLFGVGGGGVTGWVNTLTTFNGELIVGGVFNDANGVLASNVARWNGSVWNALGAGVGGEVFSSSVYAGSLVVAGVFTTAGAAPANHIASWNGTSWQALGTGLGFGSQRVSGLSVFGGDLVATGSFASAGGTIVHGIARWNGATWSGWPGGINGVVNAFTELGGDVIAAGTEYTGATSRGFVRRWTGGTWQPVGLGMDQVQGPNPMTTAVSALAVYNGELIAGGTFSHADGSPASNIARWTGSAWASLGTGVNGPIFALTVRNGLLVAGGWFTQAGGAGPSSVAPWNGTTWQSLNLPSPFVYALGVWNGNLIAGTDTSVTQWNGTSWTTLGSITGIPGSGVKALAVFNGDLVAAGEFNGVAGVPASQIARYDGLAWHPLASGLTSIVPVNGTAALAVFGGELIAGGAFVSASGVSTNKIAAWTGSTWHAVSPTANGLAEGGPSAAVSTLVKALTVYGGALLAGGSFSTAGGGAVGSAFVARFSSPLPFVRASQPMGNGTGVQIENRWLVPGHEYFDIFSADTCGAGPGTGPYGGLCSNNFASLVQQALLPLGAVPFHYLATGASATFGPYPAPIGFTFDVLCIDSVNVATGSLGCLSAVSRYTVN